MYRVLAVSESDANRQFLQDALCRDFDLRLAEIITVEDIRRTILDSEIDLVILDHELGALDGLSALRGLRADDDVSATPVVMVTCADVDSQTVMAFNCGATDCLSLPCSKLVIQARVQAACRRSSGSEHAPSGQPEGRTIAFIGAKGGVGTTTVAVNAGVALLEREHSVAIADLRGFFGTMSAHFGVYPDEHPHNLAEILDEPADIITPASVGQLLVHHISGMKVLLGAQKGDGYHRITAEQAERLVLSLQQHARYTIFDLPPCPTEAVEAVLRHCEQVYVVLEREPASLQAAKVLLSTLISDGVVHGDIGAVVVNRTGVAFPIQLDYLRKHLSCPIVAMIPPASEACAAAARSREPLVSFCHDSDCAEALEELADKLTQHHLCQLAF